MIWSFSQSRAFRRCQRQWYLDAIVANGNARKDPIRREAYKLSKLQDINSWRGSLVDRVISKVVVPGMQIRHLPNLKVVLRTAKDLFDRQCAFARKHRMREPDTKLSGDNDEFAAWRAIEYGEGVDDSSLEVAWSDVEKSLSNLYAMHELIASLSEAIQLLPQRPLSFKTEDISIRAVPDLIAFYRNQPPIIVDWKVHSRDSYDYWLQLAGYALALTRCKDHRDFMLSVSQYRPTEIRLIEVQLLTNKRREYVLTEDDVIEVEANILDSALEMTLALGDLKSKTVKPEHFPATHSPDVCRWCSFRSLCWGREP